MRRIVWKLAAAPATLMVGGCMTVEHSSDHAARPPTDARVETAAVADPSALATADATAEALPVDDWIRTALENNPTIRAARLNVLALQHRIPQAKSLDDPVVSNSIFPIPSVAPQYSLMGYMPYSGVLAQQFPWFGTLRLRGQAAAEDVRVALFELAATQLDVIVGVKSAYHDLRFNERALTLLEENRQLAEEFVEVAKVRYRTATAVQADVLRAETAVADVDREILAANQAVVEARDELARLMRIDPETPLSAGTARPPEDVPRELRRLVEIADRRPELQGRLAAVARDAKAVELARKKFLPDVSLGAIYESMNKVNAMTPQTAGGMPNVGLFVGFNVPLYRKRIRAGVNEAVARAGADAALYEAERDQTRREVKDALNFARTQRGVLDLLRRSNLPTAKSIFELTRDEYRADKPGVDYIVLLSAWREWLQVELQVAQIEAELGKGLARLERAVGSRLNEDPPPPEEFEPPPEPEASPPPTADPGPFQERGESS